MQEFPFSLIEPMHAVLSGTAGDASLEIKLQPFEFNGERVATSLRLEGIDIPSTDLAALSNQNFKFPINPEDGYIDGSIYLEHAHHPVDITQMSFGDGTVSIQGTIVFEFEGLDDYSNTPFSLTARIESAES